jgi:hypothetical protein
MRGTWSSGADKINQKIAPTTSFVLPLDESKSSVPNIEFKTLTLVPC